MSMLFKRIKDLATSITTFRTGDVIPVDGPDGTAKMSKDDLLRMAAENALSSIHSLSETATEAEIGAGYYFVIDGVNGKKKLPAEAVATVGDFFSPAKESFLFNFVQGAAHVAGVFNLPSTIRIRDNRFYSVGSFVACLAASGYKYMLFFYDRPEDVASACVGSKAFSTGIYTANDLKSAFPTAKFLRFLVANVSDTDITPAEAPSAIFVNMKKISYMDAAYSAEENLKGAQAKSLKVVVSGFDENGEQILRSINTNQFGENIAPHKDKAVSFEYGWLGGSGSNNLYLDASTIFVFKRTKEYFRNNGDVLGYDGWLFGWNENKEYVGRTKYVAGSSIPANYFWCKFVIEKFKPLDFVSFSMEQGSFEVDGTPIDSVRRIRTANFLEYDEIKNDIVIPQNDYVGALFIRCYDANYSFVKEAFVRLASSAYPFDPSRTFAWLIGDSTNVKYVKFAMSWLDDRGVVPSQASELFAFCTSTEENPVFGSSRFLNAIEKSLNWDNGHATIHFSYPVYIGEENYYSSGLLRLPYDYCENGKPSKIVIFVHGSAHLGNLNSSEFGYPAYVDYLTKEGYAVMDCYPNTSKYYGGDFGTWSCDWGAPVGSASYAAAFKWVCENYNIDQNRVFVTGKSQGGIGAVKLAYGYSGMKVNACAPFAPLLGSAHWGYSKYDFRIIADSCGFEGTMPDISSYTEAGFRYSTMPQEMKDYVDANKEKLVPLMPIWFEFVDSNVAEMYEKTVNRNFNTDMALKHKLSPTPIKIWVANDDISASPQACRTFIQALRNCGMDHQLRIMPNGTGGHHAVDDGSELSLRCNITTELGYYMENLPLAWFEAVQWFRRFGG